MTYNDFQDLKLSALGMGTMRLPIINGKEAQIDEAKTQEMVDYAMAHGINYYDTAWGYHCGNSEPVMGRALKRHPRESFYLATKFPGYDLNNMPKVKEIFAKQLERLQVEYFDFYLIHNVCEMNIDAYLDDKKYGIYSYLMEQKRNGRIRHLGFSVHGSCEVIARFLEAYGKDMEFCQLQINYLDWDFQEARKKMELVQSHNIPVWVMEPLRGGKLCKLAPEHEERLQELRPGCSPTEWAFRFLQSIHATVTLSGMSDMEQLKENIAFYDTQEPLNAQETEALLQIANKMTSIGTVPCTACRYCTSHCPMELDIPALLSLYNEHKFTGGGFLAPMALKTYSDDKKPQACLACGSCSAVCPQQIDIPGKLADFSEMLKDNPWS